MPPEGGNLDDACVGRSDFQRFRQVSPSIQNRAQGLRGLCCTNGERDSLFESSGVATVHEQLVPYEVQDQELTFVQHGAEAARFAINLV